MRAYLEYVAKYAEHHNISVAEAEKHKVVQDAKAYYAELEEKEREVHK